MKNNDNRLYIIRNIEAFGAKAGTPAHTYEFEIYAEASLSTEIEIGPFKLSAWDTDPVAPGSRRSLVLHFSDHLKEIQQNASKSGFYHGISMPAEFCAVASTALRRRIWLGPMLRVDQTPIRISPPNQRQHQSLISGSIPSGPLLEVFRSLLKLEPRHHEAFILACRLYQEALTILDSKPDLAYLLLVSCIEIFVAKYLPRLKEEDLDPLITDALNKISDKDSRTALLRRLLELDRGISKGFVKFILSHVDDGFWAASPKISPQEGRITPDELPALLKRIYAQRSKTLHEAEPFPPNTFSPSSESAEIDRREAIKVGQRIWTNQQFVPHPHFFERLVQYVLLSFLRKNIDDNP